MPGRNKFVGKNVNVKNVDAFVGATKPSPNVWDVRSASGVAEIIHAEPVEEAGQSHAVANDEDADAVRETLAQVMARLEVSERTNAAFQEKVLAMESGAEELFEAERNFFRERIVDLEKQIAVLETRLAEKDLILERECTRIDNEKKQEAALELRAELEKVQAIFRQKVSEKDLMLEKERGRIQDEKNEKAALQNELEKAHTKANNKEQKALSENRRLLAEHPCLAADCNYLRNECVKLEAERINLQKKLEAERINLQKERVKLQKERVKLQKELEAEHINLQKELEAERINLQKERAKLQKEHITLRGASASLAPEGASCSVCGDADALVVCCAGCKISTCIACIENNLEVQSTSGSIELKERAASLQCFSCRSACHDATLVAIFSDQARKRFFELMAELAYLASAKALDMKKVRSEMLQRLATQPRRDKILWVERQIVEHMHTLKCPACASPFESFSGCCALTCSSCPAHFCAWCLETANSSHDNHAHVLKCPHNQNPGEFFVKESVWQEFWDTRLNAQMTEYLDRLEPEIKECLENEFGWLLRA